jgi:hypothetical protein
MRLIGTRDEDGLMKGGRSAQQKTLHGSQYRRGMARASGQLQRLAEKPKPRRGADPERPQS